jgi:hypothetical protein
MDDFLAAMDGVPNISVRVERRRQERVRHGEKTDHLITSDKSKI